MKMILIMTHGICASNQIWHNLFVKCIIKWNHLKAAAELADQAFMEELAQVLCVIQQTHLCIARSSSL
jgi:hypothetical protein